MTPNTRTEHLRFIRRFMILLMIVFGFLGGFLLNNSLLSLGIIRLWELWEAQFFFPQL